ncbi:4a-hydroxytetrahydrobiopterin dehydratase [Dokdonella koreensis]|uniref:Putative pterin-4-alpha-carbinolamine dehydratase n=1 Tax=Dokdonella koreensis DS-123 TaxID=1300342 RepID=A0A160DW11_9GAMM|nr:4a-hydroxytetrahydrobiopterin dehydratase [Dokdonella koreensis]ANB18594.1 Pterin-4-alpha-carbinolamine dehydratase [Dokdonella koreensis DS-123]
MTLAELQAQHCRPRKGPDHALDDAAIAAHLKLLPGWELTPGTREIRKTFRFDDFHRTMAFINALAWIAHAEDHHPDLEIGYARALVRFSTHDVGGLSLNDFVCAARVEGLFS